MPLWATSAQSSKHTTPRESAVASAEPEVTRHIDEVDDQAGDHRDHAVALAAVERGNSAVHRQKRVAEPHDAEVVAGALHDVRLHIAEDQPQGRGTQQLNTC